MSDNDEILDKVEHYRKVVLHYEKLNDQIHKLIKDNMSTEDVEQYRLLARQRDEALNEMRLLEQQLLDEDTWGKS